MLWKRGSHPGGEGQNAAHVLSDINGRDQLPTAFGAAANPVAKTIHSSGTEMEDATPPKKKKRIRLRLSGNTPELWKMLVIAKDLIRPTFG